MTLAQGLVNCDLKIIVGVKPGTFAMKGSRATLGSSCQTLRDGIGHVEQNISEDELLQQIQDHLLLSQFTKNIDYSEERIVQTNALHDS